MREKRDELLYTHEEGVEINRDMHGIDETPIEAANSLHELALVYKDQE